MRRIAIAELLASPGEIEALRSLLAGGGIAAIPTETFYGLAADPRSEAGVRRIFAAKGRVDEKALPVVFSDRGQLVRLGVEAPGDILDRYGGLWPAPLSLILPLKRPVPASRGQAKLAVRIPGLPDLVRLLEAIGPVTATSANPSGQPAATEPDEVVRIFDDRIDLLVDGGTTSGGMPSTIVDATVEPPVLLRAGAFPWPC